MRATLVTIVTTSSFALLSGCAIDPPTRPAPPPPAPAPEPVSTQVYVYPTGGQSPEQLDRDRYECHMWSVREAGFDPSREHVAPHQRVEVVSMPPNGTSTVAGAATGAVVGAAVSSPHNAGGGAVVGAVAGAILGAAADASRQEQADRAEERIEQRQTRSQVQFEQRASDYRRAISACLEGRGYTVK
jgi:hypothetical protein